MLLSKRVGDSPTDRPACGKGYGDFDVMSSVVSRLDRLSDSLRAFVAEAKRGNQFWFVPSFEQLHPNLKHSVCVPANR